MSFGPESGEIFVIGAHYDVFGELPGADDNASGVATVLELSRLLSGVSLPRRVDLVAYSVEEPPFFGSSDMGSAVHAQSLASQQAKVRGMIAVEMVGYFTAKQPWDNPILDAIYRDEGDFVLVAGRWADRRLASYVKRTMKGASKIPVLSFVGPTAIASDASDHQSFWEIGVSAVMLTDTATIRNHHYHTAGDVPDILDYRRMALVVEGIYGTVLQLGTLEVGVPN